MKPFTTSQRLNELKQTHGLTQAEILRRAEPYCEKYGVKLTKSALSQYFSGKHEPEQDKLTILGLALNVSEVWLMGYDVPMERELTPASIEEDGRIQDFIRLFDKLTPDQQALVIAQIKGILSNP